MDIELYLLVPDLAKKHIYFKDFNPETWFPAAKLVDLTTTESFDAFFSIQGVDLHPQIKTKRRILGIFEAYWYGNVLDALELLPNTKLVYAIQPYKQEHPHNNWPKKHQPTLLPYSPYAQTWVSNFHNKGILLTMKDPTSPEYTDETITARLEHIRAAIYFRMAGVRVGVTMTHRLDACNPKYEERLEFYLSELKDVGATFYPKLSPPEMEQVVRQHSILYTGKVNEVALYAAFQDGLCLGSIPIIFSDWPEQFFRDPNLFTPYSYEGLIHLTNRLLSDEELYSQELTKLRSNIDLYTEEQGIEILKGLME